MDLNFLRQIDRRRKTRFRRVFTKLWSFIFLWLNQSHTTLFYLLLCLVAHLSQNNLFWYFNFYSILIYWQHRLLFKLKNLLKNVFLLSVLNLIYFMLLKVHINIKLALNYIGTFIIKFFILFFFLILIQVVILQKLLHVNRCYFFTHRHGFISAWINCNCVLFIKLCCI